MHRATVIPGFDVGLGVWDKNVGDRWGQAVDPAMINRESMSA